MKRNPMLARIEAAAAGMLSEEKEEEKPFLNLCKILGYEYYFKG